MISNKFNKLYFLDDSKVFRETWKMLSKFPTCVVFSSVEEFEDYVLLDPAERLQGSIVVTDLRFSKDSSYDGTDALEIVRRFCKHTPVFLSTTGIVDDYSEFSSIVDKNPRKGIEQIYKAMGEGNYE